MMAVALLWALTFCCAIRGVFCQTLTITSQPQSIEAETGSQVTFSVGVTSPSGGALQYQWTRSGGVNVVDTAMLVSGATTDTLNLLDVGNNDQAQQAETYVVQVTDPTSNQIVVSNRALLQIVCIVINAHPMSSQIIAGGQAMISVVLQNPSGVAVEWKRGSPATPSLTDGAKYSGATTTTLTIMNVDESDDATYSAMLSRTSPIACSTFTTQGSLTVLTPSVITTQPSDQLDVNAATDVTFMVAATGGFGMSYQWQKDGVFLTDTPFKYTGANSNTLTVINVHNPTDEGSYSVIVSNNEPTSVTSDDAMLTIADCPPLTLSNGDITYSTGSLGDGNYPPGTEAFFSCQDGVLFPTDDSRICVVDGTWSASVPTCSDACPVLSVSGGSISYSTAPNTGGVYASGTVAIYTCDPSRMLVGLFPTRTCIATPGDNPMGTWSDTSPSCDDIFCTGPSSIDNGTPITFDMSFASPGFYFFGTVATFDCMSGFILTGPSTTTCTSSGMFEPDPPTCEPISCPGLSTPENGYIGFGPDTECPFDAGTNAIYICLSGFGLSGGSVVRTCVSSGTWSGSASSCEAVTCTPLSEITNGELITYDSVPDGSGNYPFITEASFACLEGFMLVGSSTSICQGDGSSISGMFQPTPPSCQLLPPVITAQPNDQLFVVDGSGVQFSVTAEGVSLTFQWQKDSVDITDAPGVVTGSDTNTLTIESAGQADEGEYSVVVSNGAGSDTSASASLLTTSSYAFMVTLESTTATTNEEDEAVIPILIDLFRLDGADVRIPDTPVSAALSITGSPPSVSGVDFGAGNQAFTFGPCDPCTTVHLERGSQLYVKDDNDLEFEHFVNVALDSGSVTPPGIALPGTQVLTIIDDEQDSVGISFDQASYTVAEGSSLTITGRLTGLLGEIETAFSNSLLMDFTIDSLTDASDISFASADLTLEFPAGGDTSFSFTFTAEDDNDFEGFHSFVIFLPGDSNPIQPAGIPYTIITITDHDDAVVAVGSTTISGNEGDNINVCARLDSTAGAILTNIQVSVELDESSADAKDFSDLGGLQIVIPVGSVVGASSETCITISLIDDDVIEPDESFTATLKSANAQVASNHYDITNISIFDGDAPDFQVVFVTSSPVVSESPAGGVSVTLELNRVDGNSPFRLERQVSFTLAATGFPISVSAQGEDFDLPTVNTVVIGPCDPCNAVLNSAIVAIEPFVFNDDDLEFEHGFNLAVTGSDPTGIVLPDSLEVTIVDDEPDTVGVSFDQADYTVAEGMELTVTGRLTGLVGQVQTTFSVNLNIGFDTDPLTDANDISFSSDDLSLDYLAGGDTTFSFTFTAEDDNDFEGFHSFVISLVGDPTSIGPLSDDIAYTVIIITDHEDVLIGVEVPSLSDDEGNDITVCSSLDVAPGAVLRDIEVKFELVEDTADTSDYMALDGLQRIISAGSLVGQTSCITLHLVDDDILEPSHQFFVVVTSDNAAVDNAGLNTTIVDIVDGDASDYQLSFSSTPNGPISVLESMEDNIPVTITLSRSDGESVRLDQQVVVALDTAGFPASVSAEDEDFSLPNFLLSLPFGPCDPCSPSFYVDMYTIELSVKDDDNLEFEHGFSISVVSSNPTGIVLPDSLVINIEDDEQDTIGVSFDQADYTVAEGMELTVTGRLTGLVGQVQTTFSVNLNIGFDIDPLTDASDISFTSDDLTLEFLAGGDTSFSFTFTAEDDNDFEGFHSFIISFVDDPTSIGPLPNDVADTTITISDHQDAMIGMTAGDVSGDEGDNITVCASQSTSSTRWRRVPSTSTILRDINLSFELRAGRADSSDYTIIESLQMTIPAGSVAPMSCLTINLVDDDILESTQDFSVFLTSNNAEVSGLNETTVTINDNEIPTLSFPSDEITVEEGMDRFACVQLIMTDAPVGGLEGTIKYTLFVSSSGASLSEDYLLERPLLVSFGEPGVTTSQTDLEGSLSTVAQIEIVDDEVLDSDSEQIVVVLIAEGNTRLLRITILDNERAIIAFDSPNYTGEEGTMDPTLTLTLMGIPTGGLQEDITITLDTNDFGKTAIGVDYTISPLQVTFPATQSPMSTSMSENIIVTAVTDNLFEDHERFEVVVIDISSAYVSCDGEGECAAYQVTINQNPSDIPTVSLNSAPVTATEGEAIDICATLSGIPTAGLECPVLLQLQASPSPMNSAVEGVDYTLEGDFQIVFDSALIDTSTSTSCVRINLTDDSVLEESEFFSVVVTSVTPSIVNGDVSGSIEIQADDSHTPTLMFPASAITVQEGVDEFAYIQLVMTNLPTGGLEGTIDYTLIVSPGGATVFEDYSFDFPISVSFGKPGVTTSQTDLEGSLSTVAQIEIVDDEVLDSDSEQIVVILLAPGNIQILQITILDNEGATVEFDSPSYTGEEGTMDATLSLTLMGIPVGGLQEDITINLDTNDFGKTAVGVDYTISPLQVTFSATQSPMSTSMSENITITAVMDNLFEDQDRFEVVVTDISSVYVTCDGGCVAQVTVNQNPSDIPTLSLDTSSSITVTEGQSIDICATLSSIPTGGLECDIVLQLQTTPSPVDPAMEEVDYTLEGDFQIVFNSAVIDNSTSTSCARINLTADSVLEKSEFFSLMVTSVTPSIVSGNVSESVRVQLDDNDGPTLNFFSDDITVQEGVDHFAYIQLVMTNVPVNGLEGLIEYTLTVSSGGATVTEDYLLEVPLSVSFGEPGVITSQTDLEGSLSTVAQIEIVDDEVLDSDTEQIVVILLAPGNTRILRITILDDDGAIIAFNSPSYIGEEGTVDITLTLTLMGIPAGGIEEEIVVSFGLGTDGSERSATVGVDYTLPSEFQIVFETDASPGDTRNITIPVEDDDIIEGEEMFVVTVTSVSPQGEISGTSSVIVTITDDDYALVSFSPTSIDIMESDSINGTVCLVISDIPMGGLEYALEVTLESLPFGSTAVYEEDFVAFKTVIPVSASVTEGEVVCAHSVQFGVISDEIIEDTQSFPVAMTTISPAGTLAVHNESLLTVNILDDDIVGVDIQSSEYLLDEGDTIPVCIAFSGQLQRAVSVSSEYEDLINLLRDESRILSAGPSYLIGDGANATNTLEPGLVCQEVSNSDDSVKEGTRLYLLRLKSNESAVHIGGVQALFIETGSDVVDVELVTLSPVAGESVGGVEVCVELSSRPRATIVTATLSTQSLTANDGEDYLSVEQILEWHYDSANLTQCVSVPIINDECVEEKEEMFTVLLSSLKGCVLLGTNYTTVTILDDDRLLLDFRPMGIVSESSGTVSTCAFVCDGQLKRNAFITVTISNGTAQYPSDFTKSTLSEEVLLSPVSYQDDHCVNVTILDDSVYEEFEYLEVSLSTEDSCVEFKEQSIQLGIIDDDCVNVTLTQNSYTVSEADGLLTVCISLEGETETIVEATLFTISGSAEELNDFIPNLGSESVIQFSGPGEQCVNLTIQMDMALENDESFYLVLTSQEPGVKILQNSASVVITDTQNITLGFQVSSLEVPEEESSTSDIGTSFDVCVEIFSGELERSVEVLLSVEDGTAIGGVDYMDMSPVESTISLIIEPSSLSVAKRYVLSPTQCTTLTTLSDTIVEDDEIFRVLLSSPDNQVHVSTPHLTVTILNNDFANVSLESDAYSVGEGDGNITVCTLLEGTLHREITVNITTLPSTAFADEDYEPLTSYPLLFSPGVSMACVVISIVDEFVVEPDQSFIVSLGSSDPVISTPIAAASVTVEDNDVLGIGLSAATLSVGEASSSLTITVEILSGSLELYVSANITAFSRANDTAVASEDYQPLDTSIMFTSGSGVGSMSSTEVIIVDDFAVEESLETFTVELSTDSTSPVTVTGLSFSTVSIQEDLTDSVSVAFGQSEGYEVTEGESVEVCVVLTGTLEREAVVNISTMDNTAIGGVDYESLVTTLTFNASISSVCVELVTRVDSVYEPEEMLSIELTSFDDQVLVPNPSVSVTITDSTEVVFSLSAPESICEGEESIQVCVTLETDIEESVQATIETLDGFATDSLDYGGISSTLTFNSPMSALSTICRSVAILNDSIVEPCEDFTVTLSSTFVRSVISGARSQSIVIFDNEDVSELLLFNDSPQISGSDLRLYYDLIGCARVLCEVRSRTRQEDCTPPVGSFNGSWFRSSVTARRTLQQLAITVEPFCIGQMVPTFEDRPFRIDNIQCSVHFTDQQYEYDPVSGNVTVEWEGTGPSAAVQVNQFLCRVNGEGAFSCTSPLVLSNWVSGDTLNVAPVSISGCTREIGRSVVIIL